mgnify:CR=1 FL=1
MPQYMSRKDRREVENFLKEDSVIFGVVEIDPEKCTGCGFCTRACAASAVEVVDDKCRMVEDLPFCIACGDCVAICPEEAITLTRFLEYLKFFRYLDRGEAEPPRAF